MQEPYDTLFDYGKYVRLGAGEGLRSPAIEKSRIEAVDAQPVSYTHLSYLLQMYIKRRTNKRPEKKTTVFTKKNL